MDQREFRDQFGQGAAEKPGVFESVQESDFGNPLLNAIKTRKLLVRTKASGAYSINYQLVTGIESRHAGEVVVRTSEYLVRITGRNLDRLFAELHAEQREVIRELSAHEAQFDVAEDAEAIERIEVQCLGASFEPGASAPVPAA